MYTKHRDTHTAEHTHTVNAVTRDGYKHTRRLIPLPDHIPEGRSLHLVDIENLMGGPSEGFMKLWEAIQNYQATVHVGSSDKVYVGVNPGLADAVRFFWSESDILLGFGPDGADNVLIDETRDHEHVLENYERVVVGSGDGIFAEVVKYFSGYGMDVLVVSRDRSLSNRIRNVEECEIRVLPQQGEWGNIFDIGWVNASGNHAL